MISWIEIQPASTVVENSLTSSNESKRRKKIHWKNSYELAWLDLIEKQTKEKELSLKWIEINGWSNFHRLPKWQKKKFINWHYHAFALNSPYSSRKMRQKRELEAKKKFLTWQDFIFYYFRHKVLFFCLWIRMKEKQKSKFIRICLVSWFFFISLKSKGWKY